MSPSNGLHDAMDAEGLAVRKAIDAWLGRLEVGDELPLGPLRVSPLVHHGPHEAPFVLLHEALASKVLEIVEQGSGTVGQVAAHNRGERPVLILEGESVVGAKQNRVVVEDVVVGPGATVVVPVGCVEQGRWRFVSPQFQRSSMPVEPSIRRRNVEEAVCAGRVDQGRLWRDVEAKLAACRESSATSAYHDFVRQWEGGAHEQASAVEPVADQVGMLVAVEGVLVGMDLLGHPGNWTSYAPRAVSSYALSGLTCDWRGFVAQEGRHAAPRPAREWLRAVTVAHMRVRPARGLGLQLHIEGDGVVGGGLWVAGRPAHVAAFARSAAGGGGWIPLGEE